MKSMYVVNLSLKREDGKIEQDTFFLDKKPTLLQAEGIAEQHSCSVILSCVGRFIPYEYEMQEKNTFFAKKEAEKKEAENVLS